jgi:hypothetical protein
MSFRFFGLVAGLLLLGAMPSQATMVYVTYTGTVGDPTNQSGATDTAGWFGPAGSNLMGARYEATFVFDVVFGPDNPANPMQNTVAGGSLLGNASPSLGATVRIGGHSLTLGGSYLGLALGENFGGSDGWTHQLHLTHDGPFRLSQEIYNNKGSASGLPASIDMPFTYAVMSGDTVVGGLVKSLGNDEYLTLLLRPDGLNVSLAAPAEVPLPAALPLFVTGLGALGLLGWWRGKRKAHAHADRVAA